jgi:hypothetical protein
VATVLPPELNFSVTPATPVIVPDIVYVVGEAVALNADAVALAPFTVTEALVGLNV